MRRFLIDLLVPLLLTLLLAGFTFGQPDRAYPRGAKPTPPDILNKAKKFALPKVVASPAQFAMIPSKVTMWGNSTYGCCVTSQSACAYGAWSTYCTPAMWVPDQEAVRWARDHGVLNGAYLEQVLSMLKRDGFMIDGKEWKGGDYATVDWRIPTALRAALSTGPVSIAIDADALPSTAGNVPGWYKLGPTGAHRTDHCVGLLGYGPAKWLYEQIHTPLPSALPPNTEGYLLFTWSTIGFVDQAWLNDTCVEAWVQSPVIAGVAPAPPPQPTPAPTVTLSVVPTSIKAGGQVTVTWRTENAVRVTMNGIDIIPNGSKVDTLNGPFTYEVIAYGGEGTTPAKATQAVTVTPGPGPTPTPGGFTGTIVYTYENGVLKSVTTNPPVTAEAAGAAFVEKIRFCPEVLVAALALYAAYQTHDPVQIAMAAAQLAAAWKACQNPTPQQMPGLAPPPRLLRPLAPAAQPVRRVVEAGRNLFPLFPGLRSHLRGGAGTSYHESSRFRLHTWGTVQTVQTGPTPVASIVPPPPAPVPSPAPPVVPSFPPPAVVPAGHHAHVRMDGRVIVHADSNVGSAAAHEGIAYPWPKAATAGQPCPTGGCPTGTCPTEQQPARFRLFRR